MKNWEGERPREPFARKTHVPIGLRRRFDGPPKVAPTSDTRSNPQLWC